ncbi:MAG: ATP-binding cassette domain-containing protein, partial [Candidatus Korarchaeum sp.]
MSPRCEALRLEDVWVSYSGSGRPAIREVNLSLSSGESVLITGPNGAGKTTLLETCLGLLKPFRGEAFLFGVNTKSRRVADVRKLCGYVPQNFMKPPEESYTVRQVISMGLAPL